MPIDAKRIKASRPCVRCGILSRHLDRAGYCCLCQHEQAYGRIFTYWRENMRVTIEGLQAPQEMASWL